MYCLDGYDGIEEPLCSLAMPMVHLVSRAERITYLYPCGAKPGHPFRGCPGFSRMTLCIFSDLSIFIENGARGLYLTLSSHKRLLAGQSILRF